MWIVSVDNFQHGEPQRPNYSSRYVGGQSWRDCVAMVIWGRENPLTLRLERNPTWTGRPCYVDLKVSKEVKYKLDWSRASGSGGLARSLLGNGGNGCCEKYRDDERRRFILHKIHNRSRQVPSVRTSHGRV